MYVLVKDVKTHSGNVYPKGTVVYIISMDGETVEVTTVSNHNRLVIKADKIAPMINEESPRKYVVILDTNRVVGTFGSEEEAGQWTYENYIEPYWTEDELKDIMEDDYITDVSDLWKAVDSGLYITELEEPK